MTQLETQTVAAEGFISKSAFLLGTQCRKLLWCYYLARAEFSRVNQATQAVRDQANQVTRHARGLFPCGLEVPDLGHEVSNVVETTKRLLTRRAPLFDAGFFIEGGFTRVDVLSPVGMDAWDLYDVKAVTQPKDLNLDDVAFQAHVAAETGLKLRRCFLVHLNPSYIRHGPLEPEKLFILYDCTAATSERSRMIAHRIAEMLHLAWQPNPPAISIGPQCDSPTERPLKGLCWRFLPEGNVTELYAGKRKGFKLLNSGVLGLANIPG